MGAQLDHAPGMLANPPVKGLAAPCIPAFPARIQKTYTCKESERPWAWGTRASPISFSWLVQQVRIRVPAVPTMKCIF
ncbi:hypothetical protein KSZ_37870 [Dictyobacter formicarum]|uniref:Uncharacterized protein n=1 Tax=Dictyobacter formicarum TaxID=2778368 RepID=A0ABQ3VK64_9CHLR|nr:hypothetical protein KSZ_37870 [Dictyobacter formicarum]